MMIGKPRTIVFQCAYCGGFYFDTFSIFDFSGCKERQILCRCKQEAVTIFLNDKRQFVIQVPCFLCNEIHTYTFSIEQLFCTSLTPLKCPNKQMKIAFIGEDEKVRNELDHHENTLKAILTEMGIFTQYTNLEVTIESINRIHDLAEGQHIHCDCKNEAIQMDILMDQIKLTCAFCRKEAVVFTRNNQDLKNLEERKEIYLTRNSKGKIVIP